MPLGVRERGPTPQSSVQSARFCFQHLIPPLPPQFHHSLPLLLGQLILLEGLKAATSPLQERPLTSAIFVNLFLLLRDSYLNFAVAQTQSKERKGDLGF